MKKRKLYIFNGTSRAAVYGIGTYLDQLINCLKNTNVDFSVVHLYSEGNEVTVVENNGYKQISIPAIHYPGKNGSKYYSRNVAYLLKEFIPEDRHVENIFHLNFMTNYDLVIKLRKMFKCKIILVSHYTVWSFALLGDEEKLQIIMGAKYRNLKKIEEKQIYKGIREDEKVINKCDKFLCVAQHTLDSFNKVGNIDKTKCLIINNALADEYTEVSDHERAKIKDKYHMNKNTQIILFAGRLDEVKGVSFLISAFKKVLETNPNTRLLIAGDGDYSRLLAEAKDYWAKISFTGRLDKKQLYEFYKIADVGIVCSLHEEFGLVALEMLMHRLPIIVSDTGGLSEIIEDYISGLKIPVIIVDGKRTIDTHLLANRITLILNNSDLANRLGTMGRERFLKKYEISTFKNKMLTLYQNI